jgi:hypothetical protein
MAAYMVFTRHSTRDPKELETYSKMASHSGGSPGQLRARTGLRPDRSVQWTKRR